MNKTQWYFFRQRLAGLLIVVSSWFVAIAIGEGTFLILTIPMGVHLMFTKRMVIQDKYYFEVQERRLKNYLNKQRRS